MVHCILRSLVLMCTYAAVDCGSLSHPNNGVVDMTGGTRLGAVVTYSCNEGYTLIGMHQRTCGTDGHWTGSEPICQSMTATILM